MLKLGCVESGRHCNDNNCNIVVGNPRLHTYDIGGYANVDENIEDGKQSFWDTEGVEVTIALQHMQHRIGGNVQWSKRASQQTLLCDMHRSRALMFANQRVNNAISSIINLLNVMCKAPSCSHITTILWPVASPLLQR
jgi:hypothetical protein